MKVADIKTMTLDQMEDEVLKLKKEQFNLRFQRATGQLENTARVRLVRRDIARLKTIAAQKRVGAPQAGAVKAAPKAAQPKVAKPKAEKPAAKAPARPKAKSAKSVKSAAKSASKTKSKKGEA